MQVVWTLGCVVFTAYAGLKSLAFIYAAVNVGIINSYIKTEMKSKQETLVTFFTVMEDVVDLSLIHI